MGKWTKQIKRKHILIEGKDNKYPGAYLLTFSSSGRVILTVGLSSVVGPTVLLRVPVGRVLCVLSSIVLRVECWLKWFILPARVHQHIYGRELGENVVLVGHDLKSCTAQLELILWEPVHLQGRHLFVVDTPGFDDTYASESDILKRITVTLVSSCVKQYLPRVCAIK